MIAGYTEVHKISTKAHRGKAVCRGRMRFPKVIQTVLFCIWCGSSLPAQQKADSIIVLSPYERFLNIQAEYRGAVASGDSTIIAEKSYLMGKRYFDNGDYFEARKWLLKALKLRGRNGGSTNLAKIYSWLGNCEIAESNWEEAIKYGKTALEYSLREDNREMLLRAGCYLEFGSIHVEAWKEQREGRYFKTFTPSPDSALWYYGQAQKLIADEKNPVMMAVAKRLYGQILCETGQLEAGMDSLKKAADMLAAQGRSEAFQVAGTAILIGDLYMKNNRMPEAGVWFRRASSISDTVHTRSYMVLVEIKKKLSDYYARIGNWREAYRQNKEAAELSSRVVEAYWKGGRESIELMHENDLKMAELEASQQELRLQREKAEVRAQLQWIIGTALLLALIAGIVLYRLYRKYKLVSVENARLVREQSHRVKNNLQSVYNLLSLQIGQLSDPLAVAALEESLNRVDAITRVHRRLYEGNKLDEVELAAYVPDLVKGILRSYEMGRAGQLYEIPEIWLHADTAIPLGLMISELVTNSCKYAFEGHPGPVLKIKCSQDPKGNFSLEYSDNGPGFDRAGAPSSFGLKLVDLLAGQLKGEYAFFYEQGSVFRLKFREVLKKAAASD